jgi:hypothetical protein
MTQGITPPSQRFGLLSFLIFLLLPEFAIAGASKQALIDAGMDPKCADYANNVSGSEGGFQSVGKYNGYTCYGAFQFCSAKGSPIGGTYSNYTDLSPQQFLNNPSAQVQAWTQYEKDMWAQAQKNGLTSAIGKQVCYQGQCATITESSILKACQFGCSGTNSKNPSKLANLEAAGLDCNAAGTKDGAGTSVCKYLISGSGLDASCFTGKQSGDQGKNNNGDCGPTGDFPTSPDPATPAASLSA